MLLNVKLINGNIFICVGVNVRSHSDSRYLPPALCGVGDLIRCDSQVRQDLSDSSGVHTTVRSYIGLTPSVHIHLTHCATTKTKMKFFNVSELIKTSNCAGGPEGHRCDQEQTGDDQ